LQICKVYYAAWHFDWCLLPAPVVCHSWTAAALVCCCVPVVELKWVELCRALLMLYLIS
jgi:hypothetical protein